MKQSAYSSKLTSQYITLTVLSIPKLKLTPSRLPQIGRQGAAQKHFGAHRKDGHHVGVGVEEDGGQVGPGPGEADDDDGLPRDTLPHWHGPAHRLAPGGQPLGAGLCNNREKLLSFWRKVTTYKIKRHIYIYIYIYSCRLWILNRFFAVAHSFWVIKIIY